ncbi:MAG: branched-chain amino acid ABC transporter substrate-binding protein [Brevinematia bacterium]
MKKGFLFAFGIFVISLIFISSCSTKENREITYKIAVACPLTGDIAPLGQGIKRGAILAFTEITNEYTNVKLELVFFDDRGNEGEAVNVAEKIASDSKIIGVVGHLNSGCSIPASKVYNKKNLTMITPASTNPKLTLQGYRNVFRICPTDAQQGPVAAKVALSRGYSNVYIIDDKTEYGQGLADEFEKEFSKLGGKVLGRDSINVGARNFKALLTKIKSFNPDAIFFGGVYVEGSLLTKQADEVGLKVPFIGGDGLKTDEYIKLAGDSSEGDIITFIGEPLDENSVFYKKYKSIFKDELIQPFDLNSYIATKIIFSSLTNSLAIKGNFSRDYANEYIRKTSFDFIYPVKFDEKGDNLDAVFTVYIVKDGRFNILEIVK